MTLHDAPSEVIGILADRRTGKTNLMVALLYDAHLQGHPIVGNLTLHFPYIYMDFATIVKLLNEKDSKNREKYLRGAVIGLDEISEGADSYEFFGKSAKTLSRLASQLGKLEARLIYTDQRNNKIAKRLRDQTDIYIFMEKTGVRGVADYEVTDNEYRLISSGVFDGRSLWPLYNHLEFIN